MDKVKKAPRQKQAFVKALAEAKKKGPKKPKYENN
jgi:hypothetical protein